MLNSGSVYISAFTAKSLGILFIGSDVYCGGFNLLSQLFIVEGLICWVSYSSRGVTGMMLWAKRDEMGG